MFMLYIKVCSANPMHDHTDACMDMRACLHKLSACNSIFREKTQLTDVEKGSLITNFMSFKFQWLSF